MSSAKITLFSFARWMELNQKDLFSQMLLPEGVDKETLTDNILIRGGEFEVVYSDPDFMQRAIGSWSKKWYRTFSKWVEALDIEYNPLENYDRMEDFTDTTNRGLTTSGRKDSGNTRTFDNEDKETRDYEDKETRDLSDERTFDNTDERTHNNTDERTHNNTDERTLDTENVLDGTVEEKVSAFDSSTYQPSRNTDTDNTTTDTGTITDAHTGTITDAHTGTITDDHTGTITDEGTGTDTFNHTGTDTFNHTGTITDEYGEGTSGSEKENTTNKHGGRVHGNIGVTTSQQMLEQELNIAKWNLYEHITDVFLEEFIIPIYS